MEQHFKNAMAAAKFLEASPRVERVIFPGGMITLLSPKPQRTGLRVKDMPLSECCREDPRLTATFQLVYF